jgi:hypothetical protein
MTHDSAYGREYWLHCCEGFRVESAGREIGRVHGLLFKGSLEPDLLEVRAGLFGRRVLLIPVEQVDKLRPREKGVVLHRAWAHPEGSD